MIMRFSWCFLTVFAFGCSVDEPKPVAVTTPVGASPVVYAPHDEPELGLRFPLATQGTTFKMWHFDPNLPPEKFRHEVQLSSESGAVEVVIDVWDNPDHLDVHAWVASYFDGLFDAHTVRTERPMSRAHVTGLLFEQPAIEGGDSQATAAYATHDHVYRFYCPHALEDVRGRAAFDKIIDDFDTEVTR
jgi:hypothetical protein